MRVYVESNFVLELVLEQEQHSACESLVAHAETGRVTLAMPAFSIYEPFTTLHRRGRDRDALRRDVERELDEIRRTKALASDAASSELTALFVRATQQADDRFEDVVQRVLAVANVLPLSGDTLASAQEHGRRFDLELGDALVLASVLGDPQLGSQPSCFLNRNTKDFNDPAIVALFAAHGCNVIGSFDAGLQYVESQSSA